MNTNHKVLLGAAIAGLLSAGSLVTATAAHAADEKGHCVGANACKGKSSCHTATNDCAGKNGCKGKGRTEMSKADCEKMMKKNKKITFEADKEG